MSRHDPDPAPDRLESLACRAGEAWAQACTRELRTQRRPIAGAWPGTLSEARAHVLIALAGGSADVSMEHLRALSRSAYHAARAAWRMVAVPDEEA